MSVSGKKSKIGTPEYKGEKGEPPGVIVAEDVICSYCGQRAVTGEGVHEHCERLKVIETNQKVIDVNQRVIDSNALLAGEILKLVEALNRIAWANPGGTATIKVTSTQPETSPR